MPEPWSQRNLLIQKNAGAVFQGSPPVRNKVLPCAVALNTGSEWFPPRSGTGALMVHQKQAFLSHWKRDVLDGFLLEPPSFGIPVSIIFKNT